MHSPFTPSNQFYLPPMSQMAPTHLNSHMSTVKVVNYPQEDDYICPVGSQQLPVYEEFSAKSAAESLLLLPDFPKDEEIVAAAGIIASEIDFEQLPSVEHD